MNMKYLDKYKIYENDNSLITMKKDLKILKNISLNLHEIVKKTFLEDDIWENFAFKYNGLYVSGYDSEYYFDEMDIDEMANDIKTYNYPLYEALLSFGLDVELKTEYVKKYVDIKKLSNKSTHYVIDHKRDFSVEVYVNALKYESLLMEEGYKIQKKLESRGFIIDDLETNRDNIWMVISYDPKKHFDRNKKLFYNINKK